MPAEKTLPLLVLGLGNLLCSDDGLGAVAVHLVERRYRPPDGVRVLDGGTLGLSLLPQLEQARAAILVDAIRAPGAPGSLVRFEGEEVVPAVATRLSVHQIGVFDLLEAARWQDVSPPRLVLLGLVPETLELGVRRSPPVEAALPHLVERVVVEARALGYEFVARTHDETLADSDLPEPYRRLEVPEARLRSRQALARGRKMFLAHCALCHGRNGDGRGERVSGFNVQPVNFTDPTWRRSVTPRFVFYVIREGLRGTSMPGWKALSDGEVWNLTAYVLSLDGSTR
jgi:hydrogenase maturation protease